MDKTEVLKRLKKLDDAVKKLPNDIDIINVDTQCYHIHISSVLKLYNLGAGLNVNVEYTTGRVHFTVTIDGIEYCALAK